MQKEGQKHFTNEINGLGCFYLCQAKNAGGVTQQNVPEGTEVWHEAKAISKKMNSQSQTGVAPPHSIDLTNK